MSKPPVSKPHTLVCKNCNAVMIVVLYPGHMMPIDHIEELVCPGCRKNSCMRFT